MPRDRRHDRLCLGGSQEGALDKKPQMPLEVERVVGVIRGVKAGEGLAHLRLPRAEGPEAGRFDILPAGDGLADRFGNSGQSERAVLKMVVEIRMRNVCQHLPRERRGFAGAVAGPYLRHRKAARAQLIRDDRLNVEVVVGFGTVLGADKGFRSGGAIGRRP